MNRQSPSEDISMDAKSRHWCHRVIVLLVGLYVLLAGLVIALYVLMRDLTSSTDKFEAVPSYLIALQLVLCAGVLCLLRHRLFRSQMIVVKFGAAVFLIAIILLIVALVAAAYLAEKQERYTFCTLSMRLEQCACRADNDTSSDIGWYIYSSMHSCTNLDGLFRLQMIAIGVYALGVFICVICVLLVYHVAYAERQERLLMQQRSAAGMPAPMSYSEWDAFIFSQPLLVRLAHELRRAWSPPAYDDSERMQQAADQTLRQPSPPPSYRSEDGTSLSAKSSIHTLESPPTHVTVLEVQSHSTNESTFRF